MGRGDSGGSRGRDDLCDGVSQYSINTLEIGCIPPLDAMFMADGSSKLGTVKSPKNRPASGSRST